MCLHPSKILLLSWGGEFILPGIKANTWQLVSLSSLGSPGPGQLSRMRPSINRVGFVPWKGKSGCGDSLG